MTTCFIIRTWMVACEREDASEYYLQLPKLIIEVLSPSTEKSTGARRRSTIARSRPWRNMFLIAQIARA